MKILVTEQYHQAVRYASQSRVSINEFIIVTPQNWLEKIRGRTFGWNDIEYLPYQVGAFPPEFYDHIKICVHSSQSS